MVSNLSLAQTEFLKTHYAARGPKWCAEQLQISLKRAKRAGKRFGLRVDLLQFRRKASHEYRVNPDAFITPTKKDIAYLLGMLWADGSVCFSTSSPSVILSQVATDMVDLRPILERTGQWRFTYRPANGSHQESARAYTSNRPLAEHLGAHGYRAKSKVSACAIIQTIPVELRHLFFRGLFDGDGCLHFRRGEKQRVALTIASDYEQDWTFMEKLCQELRVDYRINRIVHRERTACGRQHRASTFWINRHRSIHAFLSYVYCGREADGLGLNRKWTLWQDFQQLTFRSGNRYMGVRRRDHSERWVADIPKRFGVPAPVRVGVFDSEEEAYRAQQAKIVELKLGYDPERLNGEMRAA
jgi:hypothetical protein